MSNARRWLVLLCAALSWLTASPGSQAHDLAIDQLVLWPDRDAGILRGEITFDPELTRPKDAVPGEKDQVRVRALLADQVRVEVDGDELSINFVIRELWSPGGATAGDLVVFTAVLPSDAERMRAFVGRAFDALVVSVQQPRADGGSTAWSWLSRGGEWTPAFPLDISGAEVVADAGWKPGGPELFEAPASAPDQRRTESSLEVWWRFLKLGYEHILPNGADHLLFVAGLVLGAARRTREVVLSITAFTAAHALTLWLAQLAWVPTPARVIEPLIALSLVAVGLDNLRPARPDARRARWRHVLAFAFGLLHGLGFASALSQVMFDADQALAALFSFNIGVELGQLTVAILLLVALRAIRDPHVLWRRVVAPGSLGIVLAGGAFAIARVLE